MPVSHSRRRTGPALTDDVDVRILLTNRLEPFAARNFLDIRIRIHAQTVQIRELNPPDSPLLEILQQIGVLEVHIRHRAVEPTAVGLQAVKLRRVDIVVGGEHIACACELVELVDPVVVGQVFHPPVCRAAVIRHHIHQDLQTFAVRQLYHVRIQRIVTVTRVDMVVVGASVTVIAPSRLVVTQQRGRPDSGTTQLGNMIEAVDDTLNVTAKTTVHVTFVGFLLGVLRAVVRLVTIHKTVTHDQVHYIGRIKTFAIATTCAALTDRVVPCRFFLTFLKRDAVVTRLVHLHVHEQIVRALGIVLTGRHETQTRTAHRFTFVAQLLNTHLRILQVFSVEEQRQRRIHLRPPTQRLHLLNLRRCESHLTH